MSKSPTTTLLRILTTTATHPLKIVRITYIFDSTEGKWAVSDNKIKLPENTNIHSISISVQSPKAWHYKWLLAESCLFLLYP